MKAAKRQERVELFLLMFVAVPKNSLCIPTELLFSESCKNEHGKGRRNMVSKQR